MQRLLTIMAVAIFSCNTPKHTSMQANSLNGSWIPVRQEFGGTQLPPASFATQKLTITDSNYVFSAESADKGVVHQSGDKMDIYGKEGINTGKHFTGIYKLEGEELTICYNLAGDVYPDAFDTKGKPLYFLSVFHKEKTEK